MEFVTAPNGVTYLRSTRIPFPHGFATRLGGLSTLPHTASLNLAFGRGDDEATVLANLARFTEAVGVEGKVFSPPQVHGTAVHVVTAAERGVGYQVESALACDGSVCATPGVVIGVKTADCVPILLCDAEAGVVAALHAGWRGTVGGIAREGVRQMLTLGASAGRIVAAIGPAIGCCCYAVGDDFADAVAAAAESALCLPHLHRDGGLRADLCAMNVAILTDAGVQPANIDVAGLCTCCDTHRFYSHRASHGRRGTMLSIIARPTKGE